MVSDPKEIQDVRGKEQRRGKRPIDLEEARRMMILRKKFMEAIESQDFAAFEEAIIRDLGQLPGTPEHAQSVKAWRDYHGTSS